MAVDSRTQDWYAKGTIPGAINIPYAQNVAGQATDLHGVKKSLFDLFGVIEVAGTYDFNAACTLAIFCNGPRGGQPPNYIGTLLALGYPAGKLKWYRGGMQGWCSLRLSVVRLFFHENDQELFALFQLRIYQRFKKFVIVAPGFFCGIHRGIAVRYQ